MHRGPGFVDHHAHALRHLSGARPGWADGVRPWHRKLFEEHLDPASVPANDGVSGSGLIASILNTHRLCAQLGIVEIWEAGLVSPTLIDAHLKMRESMDRFDVRVRFLMSAGDAEKRLPRSTGDSWVDVIGVKFYMDGWLGSRTCAACKPFIDHSGDAGFLFQDRERLAPRLEPVANSGLKIVIHAIGGRAIDAALDAIGDVFAGERGTPAPRIEHLQDLHDDHIARMAALGVEGCIQPSFQSTDVLEVEGALGKNHEQAYKWSKLLDGGVRVVTGSDYPIEDLSPLVGLRDLVRGPIDPLPVGVAYDLMTSAESGWTWLSADPTSTPIANLGQIRVVGTEIP